MQITEGLKSNKTKTFQGKFIIDNLQTRHE